MIKEFNAVSKANCGQLNLAHMISNNKLEN